MTAGSVVSSYSARALRYSAKGISWYIGRVQDLSHGGLLGMDTTPPPACRQPGSLTAQTFDVMLDKGEIDAAYGFAPRHDPKLMTLNIDRYGGTPLEGNPRLRKMFADGGLSIVEAILQKNRHCAGESCHRRPAPLARRKLLARGRKSSKLFSESKRIAYERGNFGNPGLSLFRSQRSRQPRKNCRRRSISVRHHQ